MASDDALRAKGLFHKALELPASERSAFLRCECAEDLKLRDMVKELLRIDQRSRVFLDTSVAQQAVFALTAGSENDGDQLIGATIGRYKVLRQVGAGGMGTVYEAFQEVPQRRVALKLLRAFVSTEVRKRFRLEVEVLGRLRHPNIAQVYEAGTYSGAMGDVPFYALEFVEAAQTITDFAQQRQLDVDQRLRLFAVVCDAVQYAHQQGVIHRDLKPTNILVGEDSHPKVIDFGVARIDARAFTAAATLNTNTGQIIGTLRYMSPEQCSGDPGAIDVRTDVYAMGVVLYELLSGRLPYDLNSTSSAWQIPTIVRESPPARLSSINAQLRGDIETIVLKALAKEPSRRYQSVEALAADLRRYLNREPIEARRDHIVYILRKSVSRYRVAIAVIFGFLLLATASSITFGILYQSAETARRETADRNEKLRVENYFALISLAERAIDRNATVEASELLDRCPEDLRNWEWLYLRNSLNDSAWSTTFPEDFFAIAVSPDQTTALITNGIDETNVSLALYDIASGAIVWRKELGKAFITLGDWSDDGSMVIVSMWDERAFTIYDAATGDVLFAHVLPRDSYRAIFLPGDERVLLIGFNGLVQVFDNVAHKLVREFRGLGAANGFAINGDGSRLAIGTNAGLQGGSIALYDLETGDERWRIENAHSGHVRNLAFTSDGDALYSTGGDGGILRLDARTGEVVKNLFNADFAGEGGLAISPDDRVLALPTKHGIAVCDAHTARTQRVLKGQRHSHRNEFLDNNRLLTIGHSNAPSVCVWHLDRQTSNVVMAGGSVWLDDIAVTHDGLNIILKEEDGRILIRSIENGEILQARACGGRYSGLALSPDGSQLACLALHGPLRIFSLPSLEVLNEFSLREIEWNDIAGTMVAWHASGDYVIVPAAGEVAIIDTKGAEVIQRLPSPHGSGSTVVALTTDNAGRMMATSDSHGGVALYQIEHDGNHPLLSVRTFWQGHETTAVPHGMMRAIAFSPDGKVLATGSFDQTVRLWDIETEEELHVLRGHEHKIGTLCFSSDGSRLFSIAPKQVCIWDTATGRLVSALPDAFMHMELNPMNDSLIVNDRDNPRNLRVFNVADR